MDKIDWSDSERQRWMANRVNDIMNLKGFSLKDLAPMLGMKYPKKLHHHLHEPEQYPITPSLYRSIAAAFGISDERMWMTDLTKSRQKVKSAMESGRINREVRSAAFELVRNSVGIKELIEYLRDLGWVFYYKNKKSWALKVWKRAYDLAGQNDKRTKGKIVDEWYKFRLMIDINVYHTDKGEYELALKQMEDALPRFVGDVEKCGLIYQQIALSQSRLGHKKEARENYILASECFRNTKDYKRLGRALLNIASLVYHDDQVTESIKIIEEARRYLKDEPPFIRYTAEKDYAKYLIRSGDLFNAHKIIDGCLLNADLRTVPHELLGQIYYLKCFISNDPEYGELVFLLRHTSRELRCCTADKLNTIYIERGDKEGILKYYKIMKQNLSHGVDNFMEGEWF